VVTYIWAVTFSSTLTYILLQLSYCGPNVINHFCCEYSALLSVSCSDTSFSQMACLAISMFNEACCLLIIITSYVFIVVTVLKIPTKGALRKAFSTCASHLTAIGVCHGIVLLLYCVLKSKSSLFLVKVATVFHSMVIPMLNPLIYSLRNKDVKETGFSDVPEASVVLSLVFLLIYGVTVLANLGMTALILVSSQLHTPIYFFLSHLSFVDFCYSSIIVPKMLANIFNKEKAISFLACMVQFYLLCTCVITEIFLLTVMAYDHFVAICNPLLYMVIMSPKLLMVLVSGCYRCASVCSLIHLCLALLIPSFSSNVIDHFFCDLPPLLSLACSDVTVNKVLLFVVATFKESMSIVIIFTSYLFILITIPRMRSAEGRQKAFSTCATHLTAITVFMEHFLSIYCPSTSETSGDANKVSTVFYTVVIPMPNPLIYSLRNKDVKCALSKVVNSKIYS
ncbi:hypothetical protein U0070_006388, partial [Myodes glareolus]